MANPDRSPPEFEYIRPSDTGSTLTDLCWRVREFCEQFGHSTCDVFPDGRWIRTENHVTLKRWEGYGREVILSTGFLPGSGWQVFMELPCGFYQFPVPVYRLSGDTRSLSHVELRSARSEEDIPTIPRCEAFRSAELFMSEYATYHCYRHESESMGWSDGR